MLYGWTSREKMLLGLNVVLLIALGGLLFYQSLGHKPVLTSSFEPYPDLTQEMEMQEADTGQSPRSQIANMTNASLSTGHQNSSESNLVVDVKGAVYSPGVYTLTSGDRVIDAIEQAGGLLTEASTLPINLAQPLVDGMVIYVPTQDEVLKGEVSVQGQWTSERISTTGSGKININQASVDQLQELPGIGPARAEAIVRYREEHGPFTSLDEITNVPGIGQKILENIMDHIEL